MCKKVDYTCFLSPRSCPIPECSRRHTHSPRRHTRSLIPETSTIKRTSLPQSTPPFPLSYHCFVCICGSPSSSLKGYSKVATPFPPDPVASAPTLVLQNAEIGTRSDVPRNMVYPLKNPGLNLHFFKLTGVHVKHVTFGKGIERWASHIFSTRHFASQGDMRYCARDEVEPGLKHSSSHQAWSDQKGYPEAQIHGDYCVGLSSLTSAVI
ncbi:hypothetical protein BJY52DRAFT_1331673 [Lactarius psammicola]|nr:hypothetical protein BJY52DRAFT_1331673 [Lactarius psammicola]